MPDNTGDSPITHVLLRRQHVRDGGLGIEQSVRSVSVGSLGGVNQISDLRPLQSGRRYEYQLALENSAGTSEWSDRVAHTPQTQCTSTRIALAVTPAAVAEDGGAATVAVTAMLDRASLPTATTVSVSVGGGTATPVIDYAAVSDFTVTIAAGSRSGSATFTLAPVDDDLVEGSETVGVSGTAGDFTVSAAAVTITDDDATPTVSLSLDPASVGENGGVSTVTATLSASASAAVTVTVSASAVSPAVSGDFTLSSNRTLTIRSGETSSTGTVTVTANDNDVDAADKTVTVSGTASGGPGVSNPAPVTLTITDDDERGLALSPSSVTVTEAAGAGRTATYTVALASRPTAEVMVAVSSDDENAATVTPASLTWAPGDWQTAKTVTVTGVDDQVDNTPDRTAAIGHAASGGDYGSVTGSVSVTVTDDEGGSAFSVGNASVTEGDSGTADLDFTVTLSPAADMETTVGWATSDGTATAGEDYTAGSGTLTFAAGETSKTVTVKVTGDTVDEADETLTLTLSNAGGGAVISTASAEGTITDDDATPTVSLSLDPASVGENGGVSTVTATLSASASAAVTVTVSASAVSPAVSGDFTLSSNRTLTIRSGETSSTGTVTVTANDNDVDAADKTVTVSGTASGGPGVSNPAPVTLTITDDDERGLALSPSSVTVTEAAGAGRTATYTVALASRPTAEVMVAVSSDDENAATVTPASLTWAPGDWQTAKTVTVTGVDDQVDNTPDRTAAIGHAASGGDYGSVTGSVSVTVTDDEGGSAFSVGNASVTEGDSGTADLDFTVTLSPAADMETTVGWATSDGTATAGEDYTAGSGTLTFAAGETSKTVTVKVTGDTVDEADETLTLTLSNAGGGAVISTASAEGTITDDDATPTVSLSLDPASVGENGGVSTVTATLSASASAAVTVTVSASAVSPAVSGDFTLSSNRTLTIRSGETSSTGTVTVTANDNDVDAADKTVTVSGTASGGPGVSNPAPVTLTITDDDERGLALSPSSVTVTEAAGAGRTATYTVALASRPTAEVMVAVSSDDENAATVTPASLTWAPGDWQTAKTVTVTGVDDQVDNTPDRTAAIGHAASGGDYGSVTGSVSVTVTDDEGGSAFSVGNASVTEGDSGTADLDFTVTLSPAADMETTVGWATSDGTATAGEDYTAGSGTLTFAAGETSKTVTVKVTGDTVDEADETLTLTLSNAGGGAVISTASAEGTITDDDATPTVSLSLDPASVGENGGVSTVTATLSASASAAVTVTVSASAVSPAVSGDFTLSSNRTLTIRSGETSSTGTVTVTANDNDVDAADKTVTVSGTASGGPGVSNPAPVTLTITDDDGGEPPSVPTVSLSASPNPVDEGSPVTVTARLSEALSEAVTIPLTLTAGSAEPGDYGALSSITISAGQTSGTGTISTTDDADTDDETFTVALGSLPSSVTAGNPSSVRVTIRDDDGGEPPSVPTVSLSAAPNPVDEGSPVTVTARLSEALSSAVTIPLTLTAGSAEPGDYGALSSITISAGQTSGTGTISTTDDADTDDETFTVALGSLPSSVTAGNPSSVRVTIRDDDGGEPPSVPTVSLSASPNPVDEGSPVTATARLSEALSSAVTIPLTLTAGSAEPGDYGALSSITISAGQTSGTGTISTTDDADTDDETFTVALGSLPSSVTAGNPSSVRVTIRDDDGGEPPSVPTVSLSASPNPVDEGSPVTATARLSEALSSAVTIPLTLTAGSAEPGDYGALSSITISAGQTSGTGTISTTDDADTDDETFTVALGSLPSSVTAGNPSSVRVTIRDDDGGEPPSVPTVSLSASPNPVDEGSPVTATARLSEALSSAVTIPLTLTAGSAEPGDYGALSNITISAGQTSGTGTISTTDDADTDDETFTVALGSLPSSVTAGNPSSVRVTIRDHTPSNRAPSVSVSCDPCEVKPGGEVRLEASASDPDGDALTYEWSAPRGSFTGDTDGASARWRAPSATGRVTVRVRVSDGHGGTASATVAVEVTNEPPVFAASSYRFELLENEDGSQRTVVLGHVHASDPDGDAVTYDLLSGESGKRFRLGRNDGAVRYIGPGEDYESEPNRYELTVRARDPHGAEAQAQVVVEVTNVNEPPEAEDDEASTAEDEAVVVDVLANDTDPDGDTLRVASVTAPAHGTARVAAGWVTYTPDANYHGTDRFNYVAADGEGLTAEAAVEVTIAPVNDAPRAVGTIPSRTLGENGAAEEVDVGPYFEDVDGDALEYRAVSSDPRMVEAAVAGTVLTLTPLEYGPAVVTVTAADGEGLTAEQTFQVRVSDHLARGAVWQTLAGMARGHLASARMTLGRRASSGRVDGGSRLTVLGRSVPLDGASAQSAGALLLAGWTAGAGGYDRWSGRPGLGGNGDGAPGIGLASPAGIPGGMAMGPAGLGPIGDAAGFEPGAGGFDALFGSFGGLGGGMDPLRGSEFQLALGGGQGETDGETRPGRRWQAWGQGDIQTFAGAPSSATGYEGDVRTAYMGLDTALSEQWLAGVAVSRSFGGGDWRAGGTRGVLSTRLTAAYPYVQWSEGPNSVWVAAGGGWGSAENVRQTGRAGTSGLNLRLGLAEVRRQIGAAGGGMRFAARADAAWAQLRTGTGEETIDRQVAAVNQVRAGAEVSRPLRWDNGASLSPFGELHVRRDGGAGQTGTGMEVVAGTRFAAGRVRVDAQGRLLVLHSASGYRERGVGVTLGVRSRDRTGLSLSVSPRWGDAATGGGTLWQEHVYRRYLPKATGDAWAMDARGEYGVRLPSGGLLTWFGSLSQSTYGKRFVVGGRVGMQEGMLSPGW